MEHSNIHDFSAHPKFYDHRRYGKLHFSFFVNMSEEESEEKDGE